MDEFRFNNEEKKRLERLGAEAVVLFGSRALGLSRKGSDYDFGILLKDKNVLKSLEKRKKIYDELYDLFSEKVNELVNIDMVFLEDAPGELQTHAAKYGIPLYEKSQRVFSSFKEYVILTQADFEPYKNMFQQAILSRI